MIPNTVPKFLIEDIDWGTFAPTYPYRFNGPGYLYCVSCQCFIRVVRPTGSGLSCSGCGKVLALDTN